MISDVDDELRGAVQAAPEDRRAAGARRAAADRLSALAQSAPPARGAKPFRRSRSSGCRIGSPARRRTARSRRRAWDRLARGIVRLNAAGVKIGVGTDGGGQSGDQFIGWTMHTEMENIVARRHDAGAGRSRRPRGRRRRCSGSTIWARGRGQERGFRRARRQSARRHHEHAHESRKYSCAGTEVDRAKLRAGWTNESR